MCDVLGRVGDLLDGAGDLENARHVLGILGTSGREDRNLPEVAQVVEHPLFETPDLFGEFLVGEEDGRVGEVDHQLGCVFDLRQVTLDGSWTFSRIHSLRSPFWLGYSEQDKCDH